VDAVIYDAAHAATVSRMPDNIPWSRVKGIVADALTCPPPGRAGFLDVACGDDLALRREVESLLAAHDAASDFIEQPAEVPAEALVGLDQPAAIPPGASVGPYRIARLLGTGGMGSVYLADRADEAFRRQAAIKVVTSPAARPELVERFLTERRILAALDHPNIARLLDAGATDDGRPYIVMEYVDGERIDEYCRGRSVGERLGLFRQLCSAVHYAHQRLVIHRDIKAENILVNREGVPKLLDFGIAKLLEPEAGRTDTGEQALTPESASPEQLRAEPVTVASDVYSLGVLLYRLLAERKPFDRGSLSPADLVHAICEVEPRPPSQAAAASGPRLDREIDWITLMALRKEPSRRYGSAQQLAEDITRYLEGRPVIAAPDSWVYRTRKFARRRWAAVAATAGLILALAVGASTTAYQARRAERRFNDVRKLAGSVVGEIYDAIADLPGSTAPRELLVKRALEYLDSLATEATSDVTLHRELAAAYEKIGDVQGNPYGANLGDIAGAAATMDKLLRIRQAIYDDQRTWQDARALATAHSKVGDVAYGRGKYDDAAAAYRQGIDLLEAAVPPPQAAQARQQLRGRWYGRMGVAFTAAGRSTDAIRALQTAIEITRPLAEAKDAGVDVQQELAMHSTNLGDVYNLHRDPARALEYHRLGADAFRRLAPRDSREVTPRRRLALVLARVGADLTDLQRHDEGIVVTREAVELFEEIARADPSSVQYQFDLADTLGNLAMLQEQAGALDDALASARRSVGISEAVAPRQEFGAHRFNYAGALAVAAEIHVRRGEAVDAARVYQHALDIYGEAGVADRNPSAVPIAREGLGDAFVLRARSERNIDHWRSARQQYALALQGWNTIKGSGALESGDADKPATLEKKIAGCDAALGVRAR
jgi:tetratricopeptide (TPR) repeat protein